MTRSDLGTLVRGAALTTTLLFGAASMQGCTIAAIGTGVATGIFYSYVGVCTLEQKRVQEEQLRLEGIAPEDIRTIEGVVTEVGREDIKVKTPRGKIVRTDETYWVTLEYPLSGAMAIDFGSIAREMVEFGTAYKDVPWEEQPCYDPSFYITPVSASEAERRIAVGDYVKLRVFSPPLQHFDPVLEIVSVKKKAQ